MPSDAEVQVAINTSLYFKFDQFCFRATLKKSLDSSIPCIDLERIQASFPEVDPKILAPLVRPLQRNIRERIEVPVQYFILFVFK
jgi:hypothetical protein